MNARWWCIDIHWRSLLTAAVSTAAFCLSFPMITLAASGYPVVSVHYVLANASSSVLFTVWIPDAGLLRQSVNVVELNSGGKALAVVATLNDNGTQGDSVAGDFVFSGFINISDKTVQTHIYQATYALQGRLTRLKSPSVTVTSLTIATVSTAASYYEGVDNAFNTLLDLF